MASSVDTAFPAVGEVDADVSQRCECGPLRRCVSAVRCLALESIFGAARECRSEHLDASCSESLRVLVGRDEECVKGDSLGWSNWIK